MAKSKIKSNALNFLKKIIPLSIRIVLRKAHQRFVFKRAIKSFRLNYHKMSAHPTLVDDLVYGWGNLGWSSFQDYSLAIIEMAQRNKGPVLECGSGLSTLLLGIIAQDKGYRVWSLEHHAGWKKKVEKYLKDQGVTCVTVSHAPLKEYESFAWYDVAAISLPSEFSLVVCDGPPHDTQGGRYGLLPVLASHFAHKAIILLDDYARTDEQAIVARWQQKYALAVEAIGEHDQYAQIVFRAK
ncbi:MAG: class I SAM-dependent methyltransferase [Cyclobacteriaceae bacterium]|nr:class I SAM-dependent methyltransferase [Cyclobacteriaceae bacterium]